MSRPSHSLQSPSPASASTTPAMRRDHERDHDSNLNHNPDLQSELRLDLEHFSLSTDMDTDTGTAAHAHTNANATAQTAGMPLTRSAVANSNNYIAASSPASPSPSPSLRRVSSATMTTKSSPRTPLARATSSTSLRGSAGTAGGSGDRTAGGGDRSSRAQTPTSAWAASSVMDGERRRASVSADMRKRASIGSLRSTTPGPGVGAGTSRPASRATSRAGSVEVERGAAWSNPSNGNTGGASAPTTPTTPTMLARRPSSRVGRSPLAASAAAEQSLSPLQGQSVITEDPVVTPADVAATHWRRELELAAAAMAAVDLPKHFRPRPAPAAPTTTVILADGCYAHRFARPRTSASLLARIVERPERLRAAVLGVAMAYVRLGGRYDEDIGDKGAEGEVANDGKRFPFLEDSTNEQKSGEQRPGTDDDDADGRDPPAFPAPDWLSRNPPPFSIRATARRLPLDDPRVTHVHGTAWMAELRALCDAAGPRLAAGTRELTRIPDGETGVGAEGVANGGGKPNLHEGDLYLCPESLGALEAALGAVCEGVDAVFAVSGGDGDVAANSGGPDPTNNNSSTNTTNTTVLPQPSPRAFVCLRPPGHHCAADWPSGFCWLNNVHIAIAHAAVVHGLTHAAILDFDLHHGDGSQAIAWEQNARAANATTSGAKSGSGSSPLNRTAIGYFSLHDINSFPCETGDLDKVSAASVCIDGAHGQAIWNVHLEPWQAEAEFWRLYEAKYAMLLDKARAFLRRHTARLREAAATTTGAASSAKRSPPRPPRAAIFLSAGFDASEHEGAGMRRHAVTLPTAFYARFAADVARLAAEPETGAEGRVVGVLEGGYGDRAIASGVFACLCGLVTGADGKNGGNEGNDGISLENADTPHEQPRLGTEISARFHVKDTTTPDQSIPNVYQPQFMSTRLSPSPSFDPDWWSASNLAAIEAVANPPPANNPPPRRVPRDKPAPTYSSPTQSSAAKAVAPRRSLARLAEQAQAQARTYQSRSPSFGPETTARRPPRPSVDWATAACELARALIPTDRPVSSHGATELRRRAAAAPSVEWNQIFFGDDPARVADAAIAAATEGGGGGSHMQLRERKPRATTTVAGYAAAAVADPAREKFKERKARATSTTSRPASRAAAASSSSSRPTSRAARAPSAVRSAASAASAASTATKGSRGSTLQEPRRKTIASVADLADAVGQDKTEAETGAEMDMDLDMESATAMAISSKAPRARPGYARSRSGTGGSVPTARMREPARTDVPPIPPVPAVPDVSAETRQPVTATKTKSAKATTTTRPSPRKTSTPATAATPAAASAPKSTTPAPAPGPALSDLDSLTTGVRKLNIKIRVPSPEENARREKARAAAAAAAAMGATSPPGATGRATTKSSSKKGASADGVRGRKESEKVARARREEGEKPVDAQAHGHGHENGYANLEVGDVSPRTAVGSSSVVEGR